MKLTNHKTKNSVATLSLRGECVRKPNGNVASSIAFLTGMTALALGSMFALSTPSFGTDSLSIGVEEIETGDEDIVITDPTVRRFSHDIGIRANHSGVGEIGITYLSPGGFTVRDAAIRASHSNMGNINITTMNALPIFGATGIHADHSGTGEIDITYGGRRIEGIYQLVLLTTYPPSIITPSAGIYAEHSGTGNIMIAAVGHHDTSTHISGNIGIFAEHSGTGKIDITIDDGAALFLRPDEFFESVRVPYGIDATHTGGGKIEIDLSGEIRIGSGVEDIAINMESAGTKTLTLRPGFEMNSGQNRVDVISAGTGDGILKLHEDDDGTSASETLDFEDFDFQGFNKFEKEGQNTWTISGAASDAEMFDSAEISKGKLRFAGDVTFKMSAPEAATDPKRYFEIGREGVLEVVGSNTLAGNLYNLGSIVFNPDGEQNSPSTLAVGYGTRGGEYKGGGKVVFHAGSSGWLEDKLKIEGSKDSEVLTEVGIEGVVSGFDSREEKNEYLPMVIEAKEAAATSVYGLVDVDVHRYYLEHDYDTDAQDNITMHRWQFRRGVELSTSSSTSLSLEENLTTEVDLEEEVTLDSDEENTELGLRASVHRQSGGVWGRQQSLRTSKGPSLIASRGSRKEGHRIHFGYDTPAMGFMGGDMVVRTSVSSGLSISDAFSSSGRSRINMESNAVALSASWHSPSGFYAGGGTRYVRSSSNISADGFAMARDNDGVGVGASAKAGYRFAVPLGGMDFSVAPQVQLLWSRVGFDDFVGLTGEIALLGGRRARDRSFGAVVGWGVAECCRFRTHIRQNKSASCGGW